jgi:hypothetical protein
LAERAFETPRHFHEYIVSPNIEAFINNPASLQCAFNAVMRLDSLVGHIYLSLPEEEKVSVQSDHNLRKIYSDQCEEYSIIRDAANSYKYARLDRPSARLKYSTQTKVDRIAYGQGRFGVGPYAGDQILIELEGGKTLQALEIIRSCDQFLQANIHGLL